MVSLSLIIKVSLILQMLSIIKQNVLFDMEKEIIPDETILLPISKSAGHTVTIIEEPSVLDFSGKFFAFPKYTYGNTKHCAITKLNLGRNAVVLARYSH